MALPLDPGPTHRRPVRIALIGSSDAEIGLVHGRLAVGLPCAVLLPVDGAHELETGHGSRPPDVALLGTALSPADRRARADVLGQLPGPPLVVDLADLATAGPDEPPQGADRRLLWAAVRAALRPGGAAVRDACQVAAEGLHPALTTDQVVVDYEPVVDLRRREVLAMACVVRWDHPVHGLLPADLLLPLAESAGLDEELSTRVLDAVCRQAARWQQRGLRLEVAVPVSLQQLVEPGFGGRVRETLDDTGLDPALLTLQVTEALLVDHTDRSADVLTAFGTLGVTVALDDFGTGHSSLLRLRRMSIGGLTVDRSYVAGLGRTDDDDAMVASVAGLAAGLGAVASASGVETVDQQSRLSEAGYHRARGPLYGGVVSADQVPRALDAVEAALADGVRLPTSSVAGTPLPRQVLRSMVEMHQDGASLRTIAAACNAAGSRPGSGRLWHPASVARALADAAACRPQEQVLVTANGTSPPAPRN